MATMTYSKLNELRKKGLAEIIDTILEGTVQLWYTYSGEEYVVLCDNSVITRQEDNESPEGVFFPYRKK